jgi:BSD domain
LSSQGAEIAEVLDEETDVSRYYAELVPIKLTPEEFWARYALKCMSIFVPYLTRLTFDISSIRLVVGDGPRRYFFRLMLVNRGGIVTLDDEDEEELVWETSNEDGSSEHETPTASTSSASEASGSNVVKSSESILLSRIKTLEAENSKLKSQVKTLVGRIGELESMVSTHSGHHPITPSFSDGSLVDIDELLPSHNQNVGGSSSQNTFSSSSSVPSSSSSAASKIEISPASQTDSLSETSEGSGVLVNSEHDETTGVSSDTKVKAALPIPASNARERVLASLDADDEEEDGWS